MTQVKCSAKLCDLHLHHHTFIYAFIKPFINHLSFVLVFLTISTSAILITFLAVEYLSNLYTS